MNQNLQNIKLNMEIIYNYNFKSQKLKILPTWKIAQTFQKWMHITFVKNLYIVIITFLIT
jgi:hypothetical protein